MALLSKRLEETDQSRLELVATVNELAVDFSRRIQTQRRRQEKVKKQDKNPEELKMAGDCESKVCDILKITSDELGKIMTLQDEGLSLKND